MATTIEELQAQLELMKAQIATQGGYQTAQGGRSPVTGPYTNLLDPKPSAHVPKANFFFEGQDTVPKWTGPYQPFPCIRFRVTPSGVEERTFKSLAELTAAGDEWQIGYPDVAPASPTEELEDALASLTAEERNAVLAEAQVQRRAVLTAKLAALPATDVATVADASAAPMKRKPGRPRKGE